jgi:hypothetical protein
MGRRKYGAFQPLDPPDHYIPAAAEYFWDEAEFKTAIAPPVTADDVKTDEASKVVSHDDDRTAQADYHFIGVDTLAKPVTITLPKGENISSGKILLIKDEGGNASNNAITVTTSDGALIDGNGSVTLVADYAAISMYYNGSGWHIY